MSRRYTAALLALVAVAVAMAALVIVPRLRLPSFHGTYLPAGGLGEEFTLKSADGGDVSLADFRGRAVVLFFGYTSCPDACPVTMAKLKRAMELLDETRREVQVVLISVDPDVDTPERVQQFARAFDSSFVGITGDRPALAEVARSYGVYTGEPDAGSAEGESADGDHEEHAPAARVIPHTTHVFGLDRGGTVRLLWNPDATAEEIATDIRSLLRL